MFVHSSNFVGIVDWDGLEQDNRKKKTGYVYLCVCMYVLNHICSDSVLNDVNK